MLTKSTKLRLILNP